MDFLRIVTDRMLKRLGALFIVLVFAGQVLAAGSAMCDKRDGETASEMACCAQAKSPLASPTAAICCQVVCGEPTSGTPGAESSGVTQQQVVIAPLPAAVRVASFEPLPIAILSKRSTDDLLLQLDPPTLHLYNSIFRI